MTIRQELCRLYDCLSSTGLGSNLYFTGSRAEGLELPGSDDDFMYDANDYLDIKVIPQKVQFEATGTRNVFVMSTATISPVFVSLRSISPIQKKSILDACQCISNYLYLSSNLFLHNFALKYNRASPDTIIINIQGPSMEERSTYMDISASGTDRVPTIHCSFWPDSALEWRTRQRRFRWPTTGDIKYITDFGFHLVPVGHPKSYMNILQWRISFSVAERTLVWSFNHVQVKCYAVMKILMKEYINVHFSHNNHVLCSYFIKSFLFWTFEETDSLFWRSENFRNCIMYLLTGFRECLSQGVLSHYFIPGFNLLSIKLTKEAQTELLKVFDIMIQSDISILKECKTLYKSFAIYLNPDPVSIQAVRCNVLTNDEAIMRFVFKLQHSVSLLNKSNILAILDKSIQRLQISQRTPLVTFAVKMIVFRLNLLIAHSQFQNQNKDVYKSCRFLQASRNGFDIATSRLWYAMLARKWGNYRVSLRITREVLSSVPLFSLYSSGVSLPFVDNERQGRYIDMFSKGDSPRRLHGYLTWNLCLVIRTCYL